MNLEVDPHYLDQLPTVTRPRRVWRVKSALDSSPLIVDHLQSLEEPTIEEELKKKVVSAPLPQLDRFENLTQELKSDSLISLDRVSDNDIEALNRSYLHLRDREIKEVASDVETVRGLFQDLSLLVQEQEEPIEQISEELQQTEERTEMAREEIQQAVRKTKKKGSGYLYALGGGIAFVLAGAVITGATLAKTLTGRR